MITWIIIVVFLSLAVVLLLPWLVKNLLNRKLAKLDGYTGHLQRIKMNLLAGKLVLYDFILVDTRLEGKAPLLQLPECILVFQWKSLLKRLVDVNILLLSPDIVIVTEQPAIPDKSSPTSTALPSPKAFLERQMPFRLTLKVRKGKFRFITSGTKKVELVMTEMNLTLADLTNQPGLSDSCHFEGNANLYGGSVETNIRVQPLEPTLTLDFNLQLKSIQLDLLNDLLRTYGKVDVNQGTLDLTSEVAVSNNSFKGYIKPILKDLDFVGTSDKEDNLFQKIWERTVAVLVQLMENNRKDQIATKIPIEGRLDDPQVHVVAAVIGVLRNAFVKALTPSLEDVVDIGSIWKKTKLKTKGLFKSLLK